MVFEIDYMANEKGITYMRSTTMNTGLLSDLAGSEVSITRTGMFITQANLPQVITDLSDMMFSPVTGLSTRRQAALTSYLNYTVDELYIHLSALQLAELRGDGFSTT